MAVRLEGVQFVVCVSAQCGHRQFELLLLEREGVQFGVDILDRAHGGSLVPLHFVVHSVNVGLFGRDGTVFGSKDLDLRLYKCERDVVRDCVVVIGGAGAVCALRERDGDWELLDDVLQSEGASECSTGEIEDRVQM